MDWSSSIQTLNSSSFTSCPWRSCGAWDPPPRRGLPESASPPSGNWRRDLPQSVERLLGRGVGTKLTALAWNRDPRQIQTHRRAGSAGAQSALGRRPATERVVKPTLHHLADRIGARLRAKSLAGRTITVRVRFADLRSVTRSLTLSAPISATRALAETAEALVRGVLAVHRSRGRSRCWRSPSPISKRMGSYSWSCRSGLPTKGAVQARTTAWRERAQTGRSMPSASASADTPSTMGAHRALGAPSPTSSDALLKGSYDISRRGQGYGRLRRRV